MYLVGLFILSFTLYSLEELFPFIINKVNISYRQKGVKNISEQESIIKKKNRGEKALKYFWVSKINSFSRGLCLLLVLRMVSWEINSVINLITLSTSVHIYPEFMRWIKIVANSCDFITCLMRFGWGFFLNLTWSRVYWFKPNEIFLK